MRKPKGICLLLLLSLAIPPASCRGLVKESFRTPKVQVIDVALLSNPIEDPMKPWDFLMTLEVDNPNAYALHVAYVAYSAIIGRETVAGAEHHQDIRLGASGASVVKVPLSIRPEVFLDAARKSFLGRSVTYELNGSVGLKAPVLGVVRIPFSKTGGFDPAEILKRKGFGLN